MVKILHQNEYSSEDKVVKGTEITLSVQVRPVSNCLPMSFSLSIH